MEQVPHLELQPFQSIPLVELPSTRVGEKSEGRFTMRCPPAASSGPVTLTLHPSSSSAPSLNRFKDFSFCIHGNPIPVSSLEVSPGELLTVVITWAPSEHGQIREQLVLKSSASAAHRFHLSIQGQAVVPSHHTKSSSSSNVRSRRPLVPKDPLREIKPNAPAIPLQPSQPATSNVTVRQRIAPPSSAATASSEKQESRSNLPQKKPQTNPTPVFSVRAPLKLVAPAGKSQPAPKASKDPLLAHGAIATHPDWMEKQEKSFAIWINSRLVPRKSSPPVCHTLAMKDALEGQQNMRMAREIVAQDSFAQCACKLEKEIERGRISLSAERILDVGVRKALGQILASYNESWLSLGAGAFFPGLEQSNKRLSDEILKALLETGSVSPGKDTKFLKQILLLVYFLDKAKVSRLLPQDPLLFSQDSKLKSSSDVVQELSQLFIKGEGDIVRHLSFLGLSFSHVQRPLDEKPQVIQSLATDLRDGIVLGRLLETFDGGCSLVKAMRYPIHSPEDAVFNVGHLLQALRDRGVSLVYPRGGDISVVDITEGHREKTLTLLWRLIFHCELTSLLDAAALKAEIRCLEKEVSLSSKPYVEQLDPYFQSEQLSLLLRWCHLVCTLCSPSPLEVNNFTTCFADGRVFCSLISHYFPDLLSVSDIRQFTSQNKVKPKTNEDPSGVEDHSKPQVLYFSPGNRPESVNDAKIQQENERKNVGTFTKAAQALGVPLDVKSLGLPCSVPDEKVVISFVAYLFSRLSEMGKISRAASKIQAFWKQQRQPLRTNLPATSPATKSAGETTNQGFATPRSTPFATPRSTPSPQPLVAAARLSPAESSETFVSQAPAPKQVKATSPEFLPLDIISVTPRKRRQEKGDAMSPLVSAGNSLWQMLKSPFVAKLQRSPATITEDQVILAQAQIRRFLCMRAFQSRLRAAKIVTNFCTMVFFRCQYLALQRAALVCQASRRAMILGKNQKSKYLALKKAVSVLTRAWSRHLVNKKRNAAVIALQTTWRGHNQYKQHTTIRRVVVFLQAQARSRVQESKFEALKHKALFVQRKWRANRLARQQREEFLQLKRAATIVHRRRHMFIQLRRAKGNLNTQFRAVVFLQRRWRNKAFAQKQRAFVSLFQAACLGYLVRRTQRNTIAMATRIQAQWRGFISRKVSHQAIQEAKERIQRAQRSYEESMTLGSITKKALEVLLTSSNLTQVKKACIDLETTTRLSEVCCERLVHHKVVPIIFQLIQSCNRSKPHQEVLRIALSIVGNLCQFSKTLLPVFEAQSSVDILVEIIQIYRDIPEIFQQTSTILHNLGKAFPTQLLSRFPKEVVRAKNLLALMERRQALERKTQAMKSEGRHDLTALRQLIAIYASD